MNRINEYNIEPGTYQHYKGTLYVVTELVTHLDGPLGKMDPLTDPLICYRDLNPIMKHVEGKPIAAHQVYARPLSEFIGIIHYNGFRVKRFRKI